MLLMAERRPEAPSASGPRVHVTVDGRELTLSNLDKLLYPASGFRKADVIDYYRRVAPVMLPHLAGRPPTLVRAPDGAAGERFFEKRCPPHHPAWVRASEPLEPNGGQRTCIVEDLPTLVWLANLAALELHTNQWRLPDVATPRAVVLDLDPGPPADVVDCCRVALDLRELLEHLGRQGAAHLRPAQRRRGERAARRSREHQGVRVRARTDAHGPGQEARDGRH